MELKEFAYKEEIINDQGWRGIIISEKYREIVFDEVDFRIEQVMYTERTIDPRGDFDASTHEVYFDDLEETILKGLVGLFTAIKA
jgi:hypothetical protein